MDSHKHCRVKYNQGKTCSMIAFIFACPGSKEIKRNRVCVGQTGKNLNCLLKILNRLKPDLFTSVNRYEYLITNASEIAHYKMLDKITTPTKKEINAKDNLDRLERELKYAQIVIAMGNSAISAVIEMRRLGYLAEKKIVFGRHLSSSFINGWKYQKFKVISQQDKFADIGQEIIKQL